MKHKRMMLSDNLTRKSDSGLVYLFLKMSETWKNYINFFVYMYLDSNTYDNLRTKSHSVDSILEKKVKTLSRLACIWRARCTIRPMGEPRPNIVYTYVHFHFQVEDNMNSKIIPHISKDAYTQFQSRFTPRLRLFEIFI